MQILEKLLGESEDNCILIWGDFNARIGLEGEAKKWNGGIGKKSKNKIVNREGRWLMKWVEKRGMIVMNGNCEGDREGAWIYERSNCKSVIDGNTQIDR